MTADPPGRPPAETVPGSGWLEHVAPSVAALRSYRWADLAADGAAGAGVAVMLVPQAMGYAMLADLPPAVGLYACTAPLLAYALLGSSRHLAVGPVALVSLLIQANVAPLAKGDPGLYVSLAIQTAFLVGLLQMAMGAMRLGSLANFLSHAVISGFTSAASILILLSQTKHLLGIQMPAEGPAVRQVHAAVSHLGEAHALTLAVGLAGIALLVLARRFAPKLPGVLIVAVLGTIAAWVLHLEGSGLSIVGSVPAGLPPLRLPLLSLDMVGALLPGALTISIIGFVESIAIANLIAAKERYTVSASRELVALGAANVAAAAIGGYPVTGGLSRTAVNHQAGARTGVASVVTAILVILTLLFLTPLFRYTPKAVLAAVVVVSVARLIDFREITHLWRLRRSDAATLLITFGVTLLVNVEAGLVAGVASSLVLFLRRSAYPRIVEVGRCADDGGWRDITRFPEAQRFEGVLVFRVDAPLYFANMRFVEERLRAMMAGSRASRVVFDLSSVTDMDGVAASTLKDWISLYEERGVVFAFAGMKGPVKDLALRAGWSGVHARQISLDAVIAEIGKPPSKG